MGVIKGVLKEELSNSLGMATLKTTSFRFWKDMFLQLTAYSTTPPILTIPARSGSKF